MQPELDVGLRTRPEGTLSSLAYGLGLIGLYKGSFALNLGGCGGFLGQASYQHVSVFSEIMGIATGVSSRRGQILSCKYKGYCEGLRQGHLEAQVT